MNYINVTAYNFAKYFIIAIYFKIGCAKLISTTSKMSLAIVIVSTRSSKDVKSV